MKTLKDSILEKLDINKVTITQEFPVNGTWEEMVSFLKSKKFIEFKDDNDFINDTVEFINSNPGKYYAIWYGTNKVDIEFGDTSKDIISEDNPFFYLEVYKSGKNYYKEATSEYAIDVMMIDQKKFEKEIKRYFK